MNTPRTSRQEVSRTVPNAALVVTDWNKRGFSCETWSDPPGQTWEDFIHETDELVVVLSGEMQFEVAGRIFHPCVGEELMIPAGAVHSARNIGETTAKWLFGYGRLAR